MPTLADYGGDAFLFSTPKGTHGYWHDLCTKDSPNWKNFHATTYDNPFIPKSEIDLQRDELPALVFAQEFLAEFVNFIEQLFFYEFNKNRHTVTGTKLDHRYPLWISFDFNTNPCTAIIGQKIDGIGLIVHKEYQVNGGTFPLCQKLKKYREMGYDLRITGDRSGSSSHSSQRFIGGNLQNDYGIISQELGISLLNRRAWIGTKTRNLEHSISHGICNSVLSMVPVMIDKDNCPNLVKELEKAMPKPDKEGKIKLFKDRSKGHEMDAVDAYRYLNHALFEYGYKDISIFAKTMRAA